MVFDHSILERNLKLQFKAIFGAAVDGWQSLRGSFRKLHSCDCEVVGDEIVAKADEMIAWLVGTILNWLEVAGVVKSNLIVLNAVEWQSKEEPEDDES